MDEFKVALKEAKEKQEKNQRQITELLGRIECLGEKILTTRERVDIAKIDKEQAYDQFVLGEISENKRDVVVNDFSLLVDELETLTETLSASERVLQKLNGESTELGRNTVAAAQRLWRAIAEGYRQEIIELVGDKMMKYQVAVLAASPNIIPFSIAGCVFPGPPAAEKAKKIQVDIQSQFGF